MMFVCTVFMESLNNDNKVDMFYMYVIIPGFNITNYESQSNFVVQNIKFVFQNLQTHPFQFWSTRLQSTLFADKPSDPTLFIKMWNFFYPTLYVLNTQSERLAAQIGQSVFTILCFLKIFLYYKIGTIPKCFCLQNILFWKMILLSTLKSSILHVCIQCLI